MFPVLILLSRFKMQYRHILTPLAIALFSVIIALIILLRLVSITELFIAIVGTLVVAIVGIAWWGFRDKIEEKKKFAFYSPIHAMIVRLNSEVPRHVALQAQNIVGYRVSASLIDFSNISAVFNQHMDKFRDKDLKMWIEIEEEIKRDNHFYLSNDRQNWFDELEAKYNRLTESNGNIEK